MWIDLLSSEKSIALYEPFRAGSGGVGFVNGLLAVNRAEWRIAHRGIHPTFSEMLHRVDG